MQLTKAHALSDARISFVSLVDKAANKKQFLLTKAEDGTPTFSTFGKILKVDSESHYVTGVVYEPMAEDTQGDYMTEDEITKAAHWFMKNNGGVDIQHCFKKCEGAEVVESYVTKSDTEIEGETIKKGTWLMTMEISDSEVWDAIQKGNITGFSMGGTASRSAEDDDIAKQDPQADEKPESIFRKLGKALGFVEEDVQKGAVKDTFNARAKNENFYQAWYALQSVLSGSDRWDEECKCWVREFESNEIAIREALQDFNDIVMQLLTSENIVKAIEKVPVDKAGKKISTKNLSTLKGIRDSLDSLLADCGEGGEGDTSTAVSKEETDMTNEEVMALVEKAIEPINAKLEELAKSAEGAATEPATEPADEPVEKATEQVVAESIAKAMEPIAEKLDALLKSRNVSSNLNGEAGAIEKQEVHYLHGIV